MFKGSILLLKISNDVKRLKIFFERDVDPLLEKSSLSGVLMLQHYDTSETERQWNHILNNLLYGKAIKYFLIWNYFISLKVLS